MSKKRRQPVTCLDCKVECSEGNKCPCCVAIERDRDWSDD